MDQWRLLKREFVFQTRFDSFEDLVVRIKTYIDWYNTQRISLKS
ncbi:IS3 family transposase [uncultured Secundilactobacillus sp.]